VEKSWLTENSLTKNDVALFHYDNEWSKLTTIVGEDDGTYVHYTASTPGFSYFVIGTMAGAEVSAETVTEVETGVESTAEIVPEAETGAEAGAELSEEAGKSKAWLWVTLIILAVAVTFGIVYGLKKKKD